MRILLEIYFGINLFATGMYLGDGWAWTWKTILNALMGLSFGVLWILLKCAHSLLMAIWVPINKYVDFGALMYVLFPARIRKLNSRQYRFINDHIEFIKGKAGLRMKYKMWLAKSIKHRYEKMHPESSVQ